MQLALPGIRIYFALNRFLCEAQIEAPERLVLDVIISRLALSVRRDKRKAALRTVVPVTEQSQKPGDSPKYYGASSCGLATASAILERADTCWPDEDAEQPVPVPLAWQRIAQQYRDTTPREVRQ